MEITQVGDATLICGDCMEVLPTLEDKSVHLILVFAQQPFASDLINSNRREYHYEWVYCKRNPTGFLNSHKMPMRTHELILTFYVRLPTYNPQMQSGGKRYIRRCPANTTTNYRSYGTSVTVNDGSRYPTDVLSGFEVQRGAHPTQKPTDLLAYLIRTYTDPGDTVLDFCMGSGSTCVGALQERCGEILEAIRHDD